VTRAKGSSEFGAPQRRVTDSLLVLNAVMFAAQLLTKQGLTAWGAKVRVFHMNCTAVVLAQMCTAVVQHSASTLAEQPYTTL